MRCNAVAPGGESQARLMAGRNVMWLRRSSAACCPQNQVRDVADGISSSTTGARTNIMPESLLSTLHVESYMEAK